MVFRVALLVLLERKVISLSNLSDSNSRSIVEEVLFTFAFMPISLANLRFTLCVEAL